VDVNDLNTNDLHMLQPSDFDPVIRTAFTDTLAQLHEVFFVSTTGHGRQIVSWQSGITRETILNRSFPIVPRTPSFDRLGRDLRLIAEDLTHVYAGGSNRGHVIKLWRDLLKKWDVSAPQIQYRFYLAFETNLKADCIYDRRSGNAWLQKEYYGWRRIVTKEDRTAAQSFWKRPLKDLNLKRPVGAEHEKYKNEDLEKAVKLAFGFWLFPITALDQEKLEAVVRHVRVLA
jgi:hypothetical protein